MPPTSILRPSPRVATPATRPRRAAVRRAAAAAALAGATLLTVAPAGASTPVPPVAQAPTTATGLPQFADPATPVKGHLLELSPSTRRVSPWVATDLTTLEAAADVTGAVTTAQDPAGDLAVAGRTTAGHVDVFTLGATTKAWAVADVTKLGDAPLAAGTPAIVVDPSGVTRVFFRTAQGHLVEVENDRPASDPWFSSDLTSLSSTTASTTIAGDPVVLAATGFPTAVYARSTTGDLVSFTLTGDPGHPWYFVDVSALAQGPAIVGTPAVVAAPDGFGLTAVYARAADGDLLEFCDDDAGYHLWSVRDVTTALDLPALASSPSALAGLPTEVAATTSTGHLVVVSVPTVTLVGATFQDVSALAHQRVAPLDTPSIAAGAAGYVVATVATNDHVELFDVPTATSSTATVADLTMQPLTEQVAGADPTAVDLDGVTQLFVPSGGLLSLIPRIVLTAESEDQFHAKIEDTPPGSDCNPFTAAFGRGSTTGCPKGTAAEEWCSDFSQWVWQNAGVDTTGITGASDTFVLWGRARHQFLQGITATPAVGDAVVWGVLKPLWGAHVGIVVGVKPHEIDVVAGNSGPFAVASAVWDSGFFAPRSQLAQGDPIIGYVSPVPLKGQSSSEAVVRATWPRTQSWPVVQGQGTVTGGATP